ncbi:conjugal transfer protein VirC2 (plasmid) [Agrobacterium leguminum]|nr:MULTISPECIES: conjugal transfer protein VirC2 [Agrobacterium]WFS69647.1 conjugal transfer protein VirC2 [Agrobacterium leguminum]
MGLRKPALSATEAKRLAAARIEKSKVGPPASIKGATLPDLHSEIEDQSRFLTEVKHRHQLDPQLCVPTIDALSSVATQQKIQVFLSARPPAREVSLTYDRLSLQYTPIKSLQMILRRALKDYEALLEDGSFRKAPKSYPVPQMPLDNGIIACTSRMFPVSLVNVARSHFDPLGLETKRSFGLMLATAALACFFVEEKRLSR